MTPHIPTIKIFNKNAFKEKTRKKIMERPILLLCVDRDNDLYEKAKISAPVIGRAKNVEAATKLAIADPEEPDANAIFCAVKMYDEIKKDGKAVEIVTLAGDKSLGYVADREISRQLDKIIEELHPVSCIFVSDGLADEEIIPIIKSRIRIDSTKIIFIKQAKELEKTYFVLIEKLRDPHYAKIILGVPASILLLLSLSSYLGFGWEPVGFLIGLYALLKILGVESFFVSVLKDFKLSLERTSWIGYIAGFSIILIALLISYQSYIAAMQYGFSGEKVAAYVVRNSVIVFFVGFLLIIIGKSMDALTEKRKFVITRYSLYAIALLLAIVVLKVGADWVLNISLEQAAELGIEFEPVSFGQFFLVLLGALAAAYLSNEAVKHMRIDMLAKMRLEGKEVVNERGSYIGKIVGVNAAENTIIIQTMFEKKFALPFNAIFSVGDNVIVKSE
jgi:putative membrane protein